MDWLAFLDKSLPVAIGALAAAVFYMGFTVSGNLSSLKADVLKAFADAGTAMTKTADSRDRRFDEMMQVQVNEHHERSLEHLKITNVMVKQNLILSMLISDPKLKEEMVNALRGAENGEQTKI